MSVAPTIDLYASPTPRGTLLGRGGAKHCNIDVTLHLSPQSPHRAKISRRHALIVPADTTKPMDDHSSIAFKLCVLGLNGVALNGDQWFADHPRMRSGALVDLIVGDVLEFPGGVRYRFCGAAPLAPASPAVSASATAATGTGTGTDKPASANLAPTAVPVAQNEPHMPLITDIPAEAGDRSTPVTPAVAAAAAHDDAIHYNHDDNKENEPPISLSVAPTTSTAPPAKPPAGTGRPLSALAPLSVSGISGSIKPSPVGLRPTRAPIHPHLQPQQVQQQQHRSGIAPLAPATISANASPRRPVASSQQSKPSAATLEVEEDRSASKAPLPATAVVAETIPRIPTTPTKQHPPAAAPVEPEVPSSPGIPSSPPSSLSSDPHHDADQEDDDDDPEPRYPGHPMGDRAPSPLADLLVDAFTYCGGRSDLSLPEVHAELASNCAYFRLHPDPTAWRADVERALRSLPMFGLRARNKYLSRKTQWYYDPDRDGDADRVRRWSEFGAVQPARRAKRRGDVQYFMMDYTGSSNNGGGGSGTAAAASLDGGLGSLPLSSPTRASGKRASSLRTNPSSSMDQGDQAGGHDWPALSSDATIPGTPIVKRARRMRETTRD
ncbi:hypothetical protein BC828DRAFT_382808 [Blastocladiella britannica]|nr:hypothetical protein BC828DRAFT_382808 [Blastocladiella britannica]